jgi:hypothetical protein
MSLMPCFDSNQAHDEGIIVGRLLAAYGELELQMCLYWIVAEGTIDLPTRQIFGIRGAERRIKIAEKALQADYGNAGLLADLTQALADLEWCRQIRNQYSHCHWYWTTKEGLCFVNLEELALQSTALTSVIVGRHPVDLALLQAQEAFFWYVKQYLMYLETAYRAWDQTRARGGAARPSTLVYPKPQVVARPPAHN